MKSNKEIKNNCKHSLSICVVCGKEVHNKEQKIKELEKWNVSPSVNDLTDKLIEKEKEIEKLEKQNKILIDIADTKTIIIQSLNNEINQLKSQLNKQTEKIKELEKEIERLNWKYWRIKPKELKP